MLAAERRQRILVELRRRGVVSLRELAASLGASEATLRRDLGALAAEGMLRRTHGGAMATGGLEVASQEPTFRAKASLALEEKAAIARSAFGLVQAGEAIALGAGTTTLALAGLLAGIKPLTVVTNSILAAQVLVASPGIEVIMTAGCLRPETYALVGPLAEESVARLRASTLFLSGNGLTAQRGLTTPDLLAASMDRALVRLAQRVVVLVDRTKVGVETLCQTVSPQEIDQLITDCGADALELEGLSSQGVSVVAVPVGPEPA